MKLCDMTLTDYLELLRSNAPAPGGGSASALCGAQGAALIAMVAALTVGKKKYPLEQELCIEVEQKASKLKEELLAQVDRDTQAFQLVSQAMKLPKESEAEKEARAKEIAKATYAATQVPFETMGLCLKGLQYAKALLGHSNVNAASDLGVATLNLNACMKGAWLNVLINARGIDEKQATAFRTEGEKMVEKAEQETQEIYHAIRSSL